ncbi:hypothetical protein BJ508DRAFT_311405 [Ascobolus immersus RN42]|uniref:Uncharacterized protein n=1 Tax=Ascobolus immersus RN42 TaxID=1160509 RepID=A0A3N4HQH8_ASCIM|nr:hypothetical protein BJ508DRAFT_311405 [Ascobolus immersus RN42]
MNMLYGHNGIEDGYFLKKNVPESTSQQTGKIERERTRKPQGNTNLNPRFGTAMATASLILILVGSERTHDANTTPYRRKGEESDLSRQTLPQLQSRHETSKLSISHTMKYARCTKRSVRNILSTRKKSISTRIHENQYSRLFQEYSNAPISIHHITSQGQKLNYVTSNYYTEPNERTEQEPLPVQIQQDKFPPMTHHEEYRPKILLQTRHGLNSPIANHRLPTCRSYQDRALDEQTRT